MPNHEHLHASLDRIAEHLCTGALDHEVVSEVITWDNLALLHASRPIRHHVRLVARLRRLAEQVLGRPVRPSGLDLFRVVGRGVVHGFVSLGVEPALVVYFEEHDWGMVGLGLDAESGPWLTFSLDDPATSPVV